ncbi:MAG: response regulator [Bdellovibrionales bacterium]|nr:response regulator [Ramlibacter sp.]
MNFFRRLLNHLASSTGRTRETERRPRAMQALAGSIARELRAPLLQLRRNLHAMQQALPPPTTKVQAQTLGSREVNALYRHLAQSDMALRHSLQVIEVMLGAVNASPLDRAGFTHLSAADVTSRAVQEFRFEAGDARARLKLEVMQDFSFRGDEAACLLVLSTLLRNALSEPAPDPPPRVTLTVDTDHVVVRDNGPGLAPAVVTQLFEPFSPPRPTGSTGLALAHCQRVMRAFGGRIECEAMPGRFTQFTLHFPPVSPAERDADRLELLRRAQAALGGKRILVVDDDPTLRLTTRHKLQPLGAVIDEAPDGQRALEILCNTRYDLLVLDLNMPVLDGYALTERIRQGHAPANRDVCIVAYTSELAHMTSAKTHKAGMDGFVSKPCAQLPLMRALTEAMEHTLMHARTEAAVPAGQARRAANAEPDNRVAVARYLKPGRNTPLTGYAAGAAGSIVLLERQRLEGFRQLGMLEELVNDYLPEIARLVDKLEGDVSRQDLDTSLETLHSLLGMSGEAGASALYQLVRRVYVPMVEDRRWPVDSEWLLQLKSLSMQTAEALRAYGAAAPKSRTR